MGGFTKCLLCLIWRCSINYENQSGKTTTANIWKHYRMWKCHFGNTTQSMVVIGNNFMKSLVSLVEKRLVGALDMEQKFGTIEWKIGEAYGKIYVYVSSFAMF